MLDYWNGVAGDRFAPSWQAFNLAALPPDAIPGVTVVDLIPGEVADFRYRFWGTRQAAYKARD
ncbi:MAG: hypothetical protein VW268_01670 [Rhodospirillaceae bacterium]